MTSPLNGLALLREYKTKRISSYDRTGGNVDSTPIGAGETVTIAKINGPGSIRHIWMTMAHGDPLYRRNMILRMYWDGCDVPSVEAPIGDFFGQGWGEHYNFISLPLSASPTEGRGLNCYFPMPFSEGAKITIENDSDEDCMRIFYYIDYEELSRPPGAMGRFHAAWNRTRRKPIGEVESEHFKVYPEHKNLTDANNHMIIEAEGHGHYVGVNYYIDNPSPQWYGEGDDMFFIDDEPWPPSLHGTGTEDYFNCAFGPREVFLHPYYGVARANEQTGCLGRTHCYRFHLEEPVVFHKSLRGSIERGHANDYAFDLATVGYWYQTLPHKPFTALPDRKGREPLPEISVRDIHRWREAWREKLGGGLLWGNEWWPDEYVEKAKALGAEKSEEQRPKENISRAEEAERQYQKSLERTKKQK